MKWALGSLSEQRRFFAQVNEDAQGHHQVLDGPAEALKEESRFTCDRGFGILD